MWAACTSLNQSNLGFRNMSGTLMFWKNLWVWPKWESKYQLDTLRHLILLFIIYLGSINSQFFLESDHYVPERVFKKIDQATSLMMESGLYQFYTSLAAFKQKFVEQTYSNQDDDDDNLQALTMQQLKRPMFLLFSLWAVAKAIFIAEMLVAKFNDWLIRKFYPWALSFYVIGF